MQQPARQRAKEPAIRSLPRVIRPGLSDAPPARIRRALAAHGVIARVPRWRRLSGGITSHVFRADGPSVPPLVVKIARPDGGNPLFPIDPVAEAWAGGYLSTHGLTPPPRAFFRVGPDHILLYDYLPPISAVRDRDMAACLAYLHNLSPAVLRRRSLLRHRPRQRESFHPVLLAAGRAHLEASGWSAARLSQLDRAVTAALDTPPAPARLLHGDPVPANAVAAASGTLLIDWQCVHLGDPARDLAIATSPAMRVVYGPSASPTCGEPLLAAYPDPAPVARFRRQKVAFHLQMISHCLWRARAGHAAFATALGFEIAALDADLGADPKA